MSKLEAPVPTFTLTVNDRPYTFKAKTFAKVSKKAGQLLKNGIYEDSITTTASDESIQAFINACNLQQFKVTSTNAFELLDLAVGYKIVNLEKFVRNYITTKDLKRPGGEDETDYLGIFLEKMKERTLQQEDYINVASRINVYIEDQRMSEIYLIPMYRLILCTDYTALDHKKLNSFVLKLLNEKPETAVPLLLRIDFSQLTSEQDDQIFSTESVHLDNSNYFTALTLSADRNHQTRVLNNAEKEMEKAMNDADTDFANQRRDQTDDLENAYVQQYNKLKELADKQKEKIRELKEFQRATSRQSEQVVSHFREATNGLTDQIAKTKDAFDERKRQNDALREKVQQEIEKQVGELREKTLADIEGTKAESQQVREAAIEKKDASFGSLTRNVDRMEKNCGALEDAVKISNEDTDMLKATLAAKMIRDFMRFDNFIRRNEKRFQIFDEKDVWGLHQEEVKKAEEDLKNVDKRIDKICPIRHAVKK
ncbi:hypothetical protein M9Y10_017843 [Tritrichomonas musculus]|uniref:BTB domain-containing protein n=1 Tax=Tritrichomonas musculus TaxID=1915356 RepID=A0ABR2HUV7_9EUKA